MMYRLILLLLISNFVMGQKKPLDIADLDKWPVLSEGAISMSSDGNFVSYSVTTNNTSQFILQCTNESYKLQLGGVRSTAFANDSRSFIYLTQTDTLVILNLSTRQSKSFSKVKFFSMPTYTKTNYLSFLTDSNQLVLFDLKLQDGFSIANVSDFSFSPRCKYLLYQTISSGSDKNGDRLRMLDLLTRQELTIWSHSNSYSPATNMAFDEAENQVAFLSSTKKQDKFQSTIWYWKIGMDSAILLADDSIVRIQDYKIANRTIKFSPNGTRLFFNLYQPEVTGDAESVKLDIWNYKDDFLQTEQLFRTNLEKTKTYLSVINISTHKIFQIESDSTTWCELMVGGDGDYALYRSSTNIHEGYLRASGRPDVFLMNLSDGSRKCIKKNLIYADPHFSPTGKYVVWYDLEKKTYMCLNVQKGSEQDITKNFPTSLSDEQWDQASPAPSYEPAIWLKDDEAILIYDRYDIWKIDPEAKNRPVNITNSYGRRNKTRLRLVYLTGRNYNDETPIGRVDSVLLCAFDERNKNNGFFKKKIAASGDPKLVTMTPDVYYFSNQLSVGFPTFIIKAKLASRYLLKKMNSTSYPNLVLTSDFKNFRKITEFEPHKNYNWLTTELVKWKTFSGEPGEGILYKPENFNSKNKYPVIFYFYERLSSGLNKYMVPEAARGPINIEYFVSNGYIVFCPDIYYKVGDPGQGIYNYVVSAANYLQKMPWVDKKRLGVQGHSWGGFEVNYLISRTSLFTAAASAAGASDMLSNSGGDVMCATHFFIEEASYRMGLSPWQGFSRYVKNSPVFEAEKISTPLLIMHNKRDPLVPWNQSVEMFTALRRLNKKVWMLQYDDGTHVVYGKDAIDYTIRLKQFFDYFLKLGPQPRWMASGVPAKLKGVDNGLNVEGTK